MKTKKGQKAKPVKKSSKKVVKKTIKKSVTKPVKKSAAAPKKSVKEPAPTSQPKQFKRGRKFQLKPAIPLREIKSADARERLPVLIQEIRDLDETIREVLAEQADALAEINAQKAALLAEAVEISKKNKLEAVEGDDWRMFYVAGSRSTLDQAKLLEAGVPMATIKACTVKTPVKPYVKISALGAQETEE